MKADSVSTTATQCSVWEIQRELDRGVEQFEVYLDGKRIGKERSAAELRELLIGARLAGDEANRVVAALMTSRKVHVEVHPDESSAYRRLPATTGH